ncbi:hypothetical protein LTR10_019796 [Elasticomyces elasticus]|uniref:Uncharacterized protein n=1 Tax=Exophiala sideris TaxID=1016849 RepID=A0ABR0JCJ3_9EURO|nr:hypothetical protein LTR10_019796 [Elasticomyces elasticus]KAK5032075.1 hypothetical protein LTS07_004697 [Exophiala sideris]KAK5041003.1 hypothetical protein LTR13_003305 [Exophiala sideris]KAK5061663.1 hypothetical protein LTR69_004845 [Exophiala sideris]KAK5184363.1 hypothetical protein LTR44_003036 [Eurotiomycetes sp. CCFEE 6388]
MHSSPASIPSPDSSDKSTRSSRPPGTPKPPFEPPRRRSSLFFSKVVQPDHSPKTPSANSSDSCESQQHSEVTFPASNIGRKRLASPRTRSAARPGHVAQMQRLFQNAKASLRFDVRFAASPAGSIDSRLPVSPEEDENDDAGSPQSETPAAVTPAKDWRYSTAPRLLAEFDVDVREPFPEGGSHQLPTLPSVYVDHHDGLDVEPPSSGFTSPVEGAPTNFLGVNQPKPPLQTGDTSDERPCNPSSDSLCPEDLERPLTELRVSADHEMDVDTADDSPIVRHLKRKSADACIDTKMSDEAEKAIVLPPSAKAAAQSAKIKRGILSGLFPRPPISKGSHGGNSSQESASSSESGTACPDPLLHARTPMVLCPDPALHATPVLSAHQHITPSDNVHGHHKSHNAQHTMLPQPPMPWNRTTATGSPMPVLKVRSPPTAPGGMRRPSHDSVHPRQSGPPSQYQHRQGGPPAYQYASGTTEHFRPGWYYARDTPQSLPKPGTPMYSFSTAAGKVEGQDPAPDSRIRDSYRNDTLTPLARPPNRFRKNGVAALAGARGVSKYYGRPQGPRQPLGQKYANGTSFPDAMRFRSSPPRPLTDSTQTTQPRNRLREVETPTSHAMKDASIQEEAIDPKLKLEDGEDVIEVDEQTRAAVRMSLYGAAAPESTSDVGQSLRELSPNVMMWRKGNRPPGSRKKRRSSYWDVDLEGVVRSPAARHVVSSPIKKDDVRSHRGEVEYGEENLPPETFVNLEDQNHTQVIESGNALQDVDMSD